MEDQTVGTVGKTSENSFALLDYNGELDDDKAVDDDMPSSDKLVDDDGKSLDLLAPVTHEPMATFTNARRQVFESLRNMARTPSPPTVDQQKPSAKVSTKQPHQISTNKTTQKQK